MIIAAVNREFGKGESTITNRVVGARLNKDLHVKFEIKRMSSAML